MIVVGLTGGIGSGKSTIAAMFRELGVPVYNSDERAKHLMNTSKKIRKQLIELFGKKAYLEGNLNRTYIAKKVFNDTDLLEQLNQIVHPVVRKDFLKWTKKQNASYVIQETALLFENNAQELYDSVILITAPKELRIERVLSRDESTKEQIIARMNNQLDDQTKLELADFVIENIDLKTTALKVLEVHEAILNDC
ncbi:dephospho-CoA kinase [Maribacter orientalis]|uniref:Dephospho-CoA kinase n=1 Tax=Maribacter orientalis TaxID=228957 RepID=A0A1H7HCZ4_9FLAO|nr:dephospho-CoA kinase [Maribacter orientalis]SEK48028.1 dephospho-CoA kinase [Maribacter orientalis]|tara:strand:+ start:847 stop:1431 length:585 start_codon:yes stop_codon:yes gene_type:complete